MGWREEFLRSSEREGNDRSENSDLFITASVMLNLLKKIPKTAKKFGGGAI